MMNKLKSFGLCAILFCATPSHSAVQLSESEQGEMLIAPFFTVANGMNTLITIKNTQRERKAIKVRFNESKTGVAVLEFNVYLSEFDVWTGALVMGETGQVTLKSTDESCVLGFNSPQSFSADKLVNIEPNVTDEDILTRMQTGSIEIYDMGIENLPERGCSFVYEAWDAGGRWDINPSLGPVTGGVNLTATLIHVTRGFAVIPPVTAFESFYAEGSTPHTHAQSNHPNLNDADRTSLILSKGQVIETNWPMGFQSIAGLITYETISNDVNVSSTINAKSEWVYTFPTKSYAAQTEGNIPFIEGLVNEKGQQCMIDIYDCYNRSYFENDAYNYCFLAAVSPPPPSIPAMCQSTNVLVQTGDDGSRPNENALSVLSNVFDVVGADITSGWLSHYMGRVRMRYLGQDGLIKNELGVGLDDRVHTYYGLPVIGFSFNQYSNANAQPGLLATYATADKFETTRLIEIGSQ